MIHKNSLSREWITGLGEKLGKVDKALLEKAIRALFLAEQLHLKGLRFQFKGGTSLLLHLREPRRFSIDVDIVTIESRADIARVLGALCAEDEFVRWEEDIRPHKSRLPVEHYKVFYSTLFPGFSPENYILLDVIYQPDLPAWTETRPLEHAWLQRDGEPANLSVATIEGLLGDKLTAFAPTTTGILYEKNRPVEIIKQLYDIGALFDETGDMALVSSVYEKICAQQIAFRNLSATLADVLADSLRAALAICDRNEQNPDFQILKRGIVNIKPHLLHRFSIEDAIIAAAKVMYLTSLIGSNPGRVWARFSHAMELTPWSISTPDFNRFNRLKKTNPEAFFYIYQWWRGKDTG